MKELAQKFQLTIFVIMNKCIKLVPVHFVLAHLKAKKVLNSRKRSNRDRHLKFKFQDLQFYEFKLKSIHQFNVNCMVKCNLGP